MVGWWWSRAPTKTPSSLFWWGLAKNGQSRCDYGKLNNTGPVECPAQTSYLLSWHQKKTFEYEDCDETHRERSKRECVMVAFRMTYLRYTDVIEVEGLCNWSCAVYIDCSCEPCGVSVVWSKFHGRVILVVYIYVPVHGRPVHALRQNFNCTRTCTKSSNDFYMSCGGGNGAIAEPAASKEGESSFILTVSLLSLLLLFLFFG